MVFPLCLICFIHCIGICWCFEASIELPPLLTFMNGTKISKASQWNSRRNELKQLLDEYILGTKPSITTSIITWNEINSTIYNYAISNYYSFTLDIKGSTPIIIEVLCPKFATKSTQKYPIIMTQYNHREWSIYAVQRRFCSIRTPTSDTRDDSDQFQALFPNATWGRIARRSWLDSKIIDFIINILSKQSNDIGSYLDINNIGIFGHSRNGKQSLITTAYDERIGAVVGSSSGMPISAPFRLTARDFYGETVKSDTINNRDWWTPEIQQFFGKENECPADGHFITALIAPRYVMLANAMNDNSGDESFANDKNYLINKPVFYHLLNATMGTLTVQHRTGSHHGYVSIATYLDFFSFAFAKYNDISPQIINKFINPLVLHGFSFNEWNETFSKYINYTIPDLDESLINRISWLLGTDVIGIGGGLSPGTTECDEGQKSANNNYKVLMMNEWNYIYSNSPKYKVKSISIGFGGYINGNVYYPIINDNTLSLPVIIHLHPFSYHLGFVPNYVISEENTTSSSFYYYFAAQGYIVVTFDEIGFGQRIFEGTYFYDRYGSLQQSKFGHMVNDVRFLIDILQCQTKEVRENMNIYPQCATGDIYTGTVYSNNIDRIPNINISTLTIVGYGVGGSVALHAAALDHRIINIATIAGFTPFRNNTNNLSNSGNHYFYDYHGLIPKLGLFQGNEIKIPYDYIDLFNSISPRNVLIYAPTMDRNANNNAVQECLNDIKPFWMNKNAQNNLTIITPNDVSNFCNMQYQVIQQWLQNTTSS